MLQAALAGKTIGRAAGSFVIARWSAGAREFR
jgi:hypothetical protein